MKKNIYIIVAIIILFIGILLIFNNNGTENKEIDNSENKEIVIDYNITYDDIELDDTIPTDAVKVNLDNEKDVYKITSGGVYHLTGSLNGYIEVDTKSNVRLILDNVKITSDNYSAIYVENADKFVITLLEDTKNYLIDGTSYNNLDDEDEPNATIFSHSDLTINGLGYLNIDSNYEDGIVSKDSLKILNGEFDINSKDDGIRGKDYLYITDGDFNIESFGDSLKSTDSDLGYVYIKNGTFDLKSESDGIQAESNVVIENGTFNIETNENNNSDSFKGIKATNEIVITDGIFNLNTVDDSIHSNNDVIIKNGTFEIETDDDGIHADNNLTIENGYVNILNSYEGLEGSNVIINDGEIYLKSSDDGINAGGGNDSSGFGLRRDNFRSNSSSSSKIEIKGGYIYVNASGDGIDSNGNIEMIDGTLIIDGPTNNGNGAIDYESSFNISGGTLIASGTSGMAQTPSKSSSQYIISINSSFNANELIYILDEEDNEIISYAPSKSYQSFIISTPNIKLGKTYSIYNSSKCNSSENKLCISHTNGSLLGSVEISSIITTYGSGSSGMMNGGMNRPNDNKHNIQMR